MRDRWTIFWLMIKIIAMTKQKKIKENQHKLKNFEGKEKIDLTDTTLGKTIPSSVVPTRYFEFVLLTNPLKFIHPERFL